jgi:hypothetical protein
MSAENAKLYVVNPDVSCREEGPDGALLFNPDTDDVLVINVTGLLIWQALAEPSSQEDIAAALVERCNNVPDQVAQDVEEFIERLVDKKFVDVHKEAIA